MTSPPTASASKTSRSVTSSGRVKNRSIAPLPASAGSRGSADHRPERRLAEQEVGEDRPPAQQVLLDGEHRLAGLLGGRAGTLAGRELQPLRGRRVLRARTQGDTAARGVGQADAGAVHPQHPGGGPGEADGQQFGPPEAGLLRLGQGLLEPPGDGHGFPLPPEAPSEPGPRSLTGAAPGARRCDHGAMAAGNTVRVLPYGDRALLVELPDLAAVGAVRAALERSPLPGQRELVPAARTVLVVLDRPPVETDAAAVGRIPLEPDAGPVATRQVDLPVVFDGPDLAEVAALTGRPVRALVEALTTTEFTVAFGGFAPGFAYLTGLPPELQVPRRATPRTRVPAGLGRPRRAVRRRLSARLARRLAAGRPHRRRAVRRRPGIPGAAGTRGLRAVPRGGLSADGAGARSAGDGPGPRPRGLGGHRGDAVRRRRPPRRRARQPARGQRPVGRRWSR